MQLRSFNRITYFLNKKYFDSIGKVCESNKTDVLLFTDCFYKVKLNRFGKTPDVSETNAVERLPIL